MLNSASSCPNAVPMSVLSGIAIAVLVIAEDQRLDDVAQRAAVAGEVLLHAHGAAAKGHDRQQIRRLHLRVDEGLRGGIRAHLIRRRHRGQIEIEHEQSSIAVARVARRRDGDLPLRRRRRGGGGREARRRFGRTGGRGAIWQALVFDETDGLRLAVLRDDEVVCAQTLDRRDRLDP